MVCQSVSGYGLREPGSLRVLHVTVGVDTGGAMAHLLTLLPALRSNGCDAHLLSMGAHRDLATAARDAGVPVRILEMTRARDPRVMPRLWTELVSENWDVVHTHGMRANLPVRMLWPAVKRRVGDSCLFSTVHSDLSLDYTDVIGSRVFPIVDRVSLGVVDCVLCVSDDLRERLIARGYDPSKMRVIRSGLPESTDVRAHSKVAGIGSGARTRASPSVAAQVWGGDVPSPEVYRVGTVARLVPVKDVDLLLEVVELVVREIPALRVAVVGDGPESDALRARSVALGLERVVTFAGLVKPGAEAVHEFDVYLLTSISEGVPMSVLEAMVAGIPVVATDVGGVCEAVEDGVTGYLVARTQDRGALTKELAARVVRLVRDPGLRDAMGRRAIERVRSSFGTDTAAAATIDAYRSCLQASARKRN